jgi:putative PIG3 family NAD(P)H quinone oxidoreductase
MQDTTLPSRMQRIEITTPGGPEVLQPREAPLPVPSAGELLIRVQAAGVNRPDVMQRTGSYPMPPGVTPIPGLEVAGRVVAVGEGATGFQVGDLVCGLTEGGGYAEYCVVPATQALPVPGNVDALTAAAIPETFFTVWANVFQRGHIAPGSTLLVHGGTSGIGSTTLMLAREFGIRTIATDSGADKLAAALRFGAQEAIDYRECDFVEVAREWTGGRGVDAILDIVGGAYFERNVAALAKDGRLLLIGFLGGEVAPSVNLLTRAVKRLTVTGSTLRARSVDEKAEIARDLQAQVWPLLGAGRCLPTVHAEFPLARAADAHRLMESGSHIGKIVLRVAD